MEIGVRINFSARNVYKITKFFKLGRIC